MANQADLLGVEILDEIDLAPEGEEPSEVQGVVQRAVEEAIQWREEHLDPAQEKATDYYHARELGNEKKGRSQVVATNVRDVVTTIMPSLLKVFFGSEKVVEYRPDQPDHAEQARIQTEYVQYIVREDNPGFMTFYSAFKDALVRKLGVIKFWWDDAERVETDEYTGLFQEDIEALEFVVQTLPEGSELKVSPEGGQEADGDMAAGVEQGGAPPTFSATLRRVVRDGRVRLAAIPPEEFIFSPSARTVEDATLVGHIREVPADELIGLGVPKDIVEKHKGRSNAGRRAGLADARELDEGARRIFEDEGPDETRPVRFADLYIRLPVDEDDADSLTELRHIQTVGDSYEIIRNRPTTIKPFAVFGPDPEPHTMVGLSVADYVMDLQEINSSILRGMLDSLSQHLDPATEVVDGEVNMKDLLNPEPNRIVRVRRPGMMREVQSQFVGGSALPVMQWIQEVQENRVGISRAAAGLDPDALQSSTKAGVAATLSASQQRVETIARIFAETGMKDLFTGILALITKHQDFERTIEVAGEWVPIDPRHWKGTQKVTVNVALGAGLTEEKLQALSLIASKQEQMLLQGVPLVSFTEYRNTLARMTELAGFPNADEFWKPWSEQMQQQYEEQQAQAAQEPEQDPATEALVQVEMAKIQARQQESQAKVQAGQQEAQAKLQADAQTKMADIQARQREKRAELEMRFRDISLRDERERQKMVLDFRLRAAQLGEQAAKRALEADIKAAELGLKADSEGVKSAREIAALIHELQDMEIEGANAQLDVAERLNPASPAEDGDDRDE